MPTILLKFSKYLAVKNYSPGTVKGYCDDLIIFFKFLKQYLKLDIDIKEFNVFILSDVSKDVLFAFLVFLNYYKDNCANTRQRKIVSVRTFYNWLFTLKYSCFNHKRNPADYIPNIPRVERLPKYLSLEKAKSIQNVFNSENSKYPERNNAIITLFLNTGIRVSSLTNLNISNINFEEKTANIIAKGNKEKVIFLNDFTIKQIHTYLKLRTDDNDALFISCRNKRIGIKMVQNICKEAFNLIGVADKGYSAHTLRHTAATILYQSTNDILVVKEVLGHEDITSTEIYTHVENKDVRDAVNANPLANYIAN